MIRIFINYIYVELLFWWYIDVNSYLYLKYECFKVIFLVVDLFGKVEDDLCYVGYSFIKNEICIIKNKFKIIICCLFLMVVVIKVF